MDFIQWLKFQDNVSNVIIRNLNDSELTTAIQAYQSGMPLHYFEKYLVKGNTRYASEIRSELFRWVEEHSLFFKKTTEFTELLKKDRPEINDSEIKAILSGSTTLDSLVSLIRDLKKARRSKASRAEELGLHTFLDSMLKGQANGQNQIPFEEAIKTASSEKSLSIDEILSLISALLRSRLSAARNLFDEAEDTLLSKGTLKTIAMDPAPENLKYKNLVGIEESLASLAKKDHGSRYLNIRRAQSIAELKVEVSGPIEDIRGKFIKSIIPAGVEIAALEAGLRSFVEKTFDDLFAHFIFPDIEKRVHQELRKRCEERPLQIVERNFRKVLMTPPLGRVPVMGICSTGKKTYRIAVVDREGVVVQTAFVNLSDANKAAENDGVFLALIEKCTIQAIAVGTHMGGRDIERHLGELFRSIKIRLPIIPISNEGSDAYASSPVAEEEFPALDAGSRKAVFIARQLQNPLAELVKVKPRSLGVGQYLNEISQDILNESLARIVKECVHEVGVDLNSASVHLLSLVDGISTDQAKALVAYRQEKGFFWDRSQILEVASIDEKTFEYCGSFLRIRDGKNPLDLSRFHPKYNKAIIASAQRLKLELNELSGKTDLLLSDERLKTELGPVLADIVEALKNPEKDPRGEFHALQFREDLRDIKDLKVGMVASGRISNVTPFGAFVDLGLPQDGLVHLSELSQEYIRDPFEIVQPGDLVTVKVLTVDLDKKQLSLSMKGVEGVSQKNQDLVKRKAENDRERIAAENAFADEQRKQDEARQAARPPRPARNEFRRDESRAKAGPQGLGANQGHNDSRGPSKNAGPRNDRPRSNERSNDRGNDRGPRGLDRDRGGDRGGGNRNSAPASKSTLTHSAFANLADLLKQK